MTSGLFIFIIIGLTQIYAQDISHLPPCTQELQHQHFPSNFDCHHYHTCANGEWLLRVCGPDPFIWFIRDIQHCGVVVDNNCPFAPPTQPPTNPPPTTVTQPPPTSPPTTIPPPVENPNVNCPPTGVSKVINPFSCTRYFMCYDGVPVVRHCSPGLYFSRSQLRCVRRDDSDCEIDLESCPAENDPNNVVFLPDQEDCQRYFICHDGQPRDFDCGPTLHWDPNNNWCIREEESECEPSYPLPPVRDIECPEDTESDIIFLPHPEDCQFYFVCIDGQSTLIRCARNTLFDHVIGKCFFADQARCFNDSNPFLKFLRSIKLIK